MTNKRFYLKAKQVFTEHGIKTDHYVLVDKGLIKDISATANLDIQVFDLGDSQLMPGFIDMHIHGREGCDVMDAKLSSLNTISASLAKHGVVGFLATTVTAKWQDSIKAFGTIGEAAHSSLDGAQVLGAYNEGLFFTDEHKGAHNEKFFLRLTKERVDAIYAATQGTLKVVAMAPEFEDSKEMITYLDSLGVKVMLGHTNANYQQTVDALDAGACGGVHIFNGMSGIHHRDPGCAGAVLMDPNAIAEVIADGVHLHPTIMQMVYKLKGPNKMALISDCINAGGFSDGTYRLGELDVYVKDGVARTATGSLAGSTLTLEKAIDNLVELAQVPLLEAVHMASLVPAKFLGLADQIGSIAVNKRANFAILKDNQQVQATMIDGKVVYQQESFHSLATLIR
ncbi:N-acetylglucosamine-6-phosphate deacetylase [Thalassotalea fonticola]|uniref:N-acetylgalactosamine-6-phosphate deacetylase n=1 Tax=Thalassotalea fonticola TaxID=3065649 RepID=A0ABZ0GL33_9GAMM|nr:N-acetylglucosamine-6-phosphate deacetylase [Colwelliaceae bacterium S1-1]